MDRASNLSPTQAPAPSAPARPPRRLLRRILRGILVLLLLAIAAYCVFSYLAGRDLREAIAEADRLDPGWRLEEMEAARETIPAEHNGALTVLAAHGLLAPAWQAWPRALERTREAAAKSLGESLAEASPPEQLSQLQIDALGIILKDNAAALAEAVKLADLPRGRFPTPASPDMIWAGTGTPHLVAVREVRDLLGFDALLRAQHQDCDGALTSCRALINAGRSLGDEPAFDAQWIRQAQRTLACRRIERILAQGEASEASLNALQRLLAEEEAEPVFLRGARGNRVGWDRFYAKIQEGHFANQGEFAARFLHLMGISGDRAAILRLNTEIVEIGRQPVEERTALLPDRDRYERGVPYFSRLYIVPKVQKLTVDLHAWDLRTRAELRCTGAALALERYRRAHGAWPAELAALVPAQLERVPVDPYDKQPLRLRRVQEGVMIYAVGADRRDDGGAFDAKKLDGPGTDVTFRIWDPPLRRRVADR